MAKAQKVEWTREHSLIALNLYHKLEFGKLHKGNPLIIDVAAKMGRTPSSLSMKLCNLASLDPQLQAKGKKGLVKATKQDRALWAEFHGHLAILAPESEQLLHDLFTEDDNGELDFLDRRKVRIEKPRTFEGSTESVATVKVRRGQQFFRQAVLNAYGVRCCITGIPIPRLLVASHIKPWRDDEAVRVDPRNGLCLSSLHDAAFDAGFITLDENYRVVLSQQLRSYFPQEALEKSFTPFEGKSIRLPDMLTQPATEHLNHHREKIFLH